WERKWNDFHKDFTIPAGPAAVPMKSITITLKELKRFLQMPALETLRRHLRVEEDDEQSLDDEEPLVTTQQAANALMRHTLEHLVREAALGDVERALSGWQERFAISYAESRLRSKAPEDAFGEIDQATIVRDLHERIHGDGKLEAFLREH